MSDITGNRPEDQNNPPTTSPEAPSTDAVASQTTPDAPATQPAAPVNPTAVTQSPATPPVPPTQSAAAAAPPVAPAAPTQPAWQVSQQAPQPQAPQQPQRPVAPGANPTQQQPAYAPPYGYAGQQGAYPQNYAGQPTGAAFGVRPGDTQPTATYAYAPVGTGAVKTPKAPRKSSGAGKVVGLIVAAAIVGGAAGLGGAYAGVNLFAPAGQTPAAGPATVTVNNDDSVNQTTAIAAKVVPSVVTIEASGGSSSGTGSGVVLTEDGYVVTNTHVVTLDGATGDATIRVTTSDGHVYDAEVVGTDPTYDLAVIKLTDASGLTPMEFADSADLNVGDATIAVGAPLGLSNTVTTGIVSALNRSIEIASSAAPDSTDSGTEGDEGDQGEGTTPEGEETPPFFFDFGQGEQSQTQAGESIKIAVIQTDAAINPGNSGGALVDSEGNLIGINVAIASAGGSSGGQSGSIGVGFSIPSNIVKRVSDEIIADGAATHGLLGANVQSAAYVDGATTTGAYIAAVSPDGAAASAGLQEGDVVTEFNGVPITDSVDLTAQVRAAAAGSDATVTYVRDGKTVTVDVTLGELTP